MRMPLAFASTAPVAYRTPETAAGAAAAASLERSAITGDEMLRRSPDSAAMLDYWDLTDTLVDGHDALKKAGTKFLPKFPDETADDYAFRLECTKFTNVYQDILEVLASKPFEQEVSLIADESRAIPDALLQFVEDVDGAGNNLTMFSGAVFFNGINSAIDWIFVDFDNPDERVTPIRNMADAKRVGLRPYWSRVLGRNVFRAKAEMINGSETLTFIKIYEPGAPDHVREIERLPTGQIVWRLYVKSDTIVDGKTKFVFEKGGTLSIDRIPLVPFYTGRRDGRSFKLSPPMKSAAELQKELYQDESGLKFARIMSAYPMLSGNGVRPEKNAAGEPLPLKRGPNRVLYAPADAAGNVGSWTYVEPGAQSLTFLASDIKETIQQLRELGRQPLTAQSGNLTVITAAAAAGKARSAVGAWALGLKNALENAMVLTCLWLNIPVDTYDPQVFVYTEFDQFIDAGELEHLRAMREGGDLSQQTYHEETKRRGVLSPEFDHQQEVERLLAEVPGDGEDTFTEA